MPKSPFARLFRSSAAKAADEDADDVIERKKDEVEDDLTDPDDPDEERKEDEEDEEEEATGKKAKKAKAKAKARDGDDDSDEADEKDPKAKAARARERGRIAAIMSSDAAAANPAAALFMATRTSASRVDAIANLSLLNAASGGRSDQRTAAARDRLARVDVPHVSLGNGERATGAAAQAAAIIAAGKRRRGEI